MEFTSQPELTLQGYRGTGIAKIWIVRRIFYRM